MENKVEQTNKRNQRIAFLITSIQFFNYDKLLKLDFPFFNEKEGCQWNERCKNRAWVTTYYRLTCSISNRIFSVVPSEIFHGSFSFTNNTSSVHFSITQSNSFLENCRLNISIVCHCRAVTPRKRRCHPLNDCYLLVLNIVL